MTEDDREARAMNETHDSELEERLRAQRPVPAPAFRGELRRRLMTRGERPAPGGIRLLIAAYGGAGAVLLAVAAIGVAGAGPLSA
jgi:hypothetical protein